MEQQWILVTGASTGIGRAIVNGFLKKGFCVYAGARKSTDLKELTANDHLFPIELDVTDEKQIQKAYQIIKERKTGLFALINNAGPEDVIGKNGWVN